MLGASRDQHPNCSGGCEAAEATSESSHRSSSTCIRSARQSWPGRCSVHEMDAAPEVLGVPARLRPRRAGRVGIARRASARAAATDHPRASAVATDRDAGTLLRRTCCRRRAGPGPAARSRTRPARPIAPTAMSPTRDARSGRRARPELLLERPTHLHRLDADLIEVIAKHAAMVTSPFAAIVRGDFHLRRGGARVAEGATAFANRQASHAITPRCRMAARRPRLGIGTSIGSRRFFGALEASSQGVYRQLPGGDEPPNGFWQPYGRPATPALSR